MFNKRSSLPIPLLILNCVLYTLQVAASQSFELWVDPKTKQLFSEAGPGRTRLGRVIPVPDGEEKLAGEKGSGTTKTQQSISTTPAASVPVSLSPATNKPSSWYDRFSIRGYTQFRYHTLTHKEGADWFHPGDRSVAEDTTFIIRRGRLILSGDVTDHVYMYIQPDLMASPNSDGDLALQMRDLYGDLSLDPKKEFRFRIGQSKVPFGFVNMQSSQNRLAFERPEAINSAAETERDLGVFFYWAPAEIRERFRNLVKDGLKGSGDYGVFGIGAYSGQGPNRGDTNGSLHTIVRGSYPFKLDNGQIIEPGIQAYTGKFVPRTRPFTIDGSEEETDPTFNKDGVRDERVGATFVLYPQPIGIEAEWNVGRSPELSDDRQSINDGFLHGGYVQVSTKVDTSEGIVFPFVRWQYYDGARKFARNAPHVQLNEWDFGVEWQPIPEFELVAAYTYTVDRTNTNTYPYEQLTNGSRFGLQAQFNY